MVIRGKVSSDYLFLLFAFITPLTDFLSKKICGLASWLLSWSSRITTGSRPRKEKESLDPRKDSGFSTSTGIAAFLIPLPKYRTFGVLPGILKGAFY
jgi:hypothetical protein